MTGRRRRRASTVSVLAFAALVGACGDPSADPAAELPSVPTSAVDSTETTRSTVSTGGTEAPPTSTPGGPVTGPATSAPVLEAPPPPTTGPDGERDPDADDAPVASPDLPPNAVEEEIAGVTVRSRSQIGTIPDQATLVEVDAFVIDDGGGPMLCAGGVQDSYPPQCSGPILDLEMGDWATVEGEVAFGSRTLTLEWPPPPDGPIDVVDERSSEPVVGWSYPQLELPDDCVEVDLVGIEVLAEYAASHPDTTATPGIVDQRHGVLQVVESAIDEVRADLTTDAATPCLLPVQYGTSELAAAQEAIVTASRSESELFVGSSGSGNAFNRVTVDLLVADGATVRRLAQLVDDPSILLVFGTAEIVDGS